MEYKISIIIPVYNGEGHIARILDCIYDSREVVKDEKGEWRKVSEVFWDDVEILVVNDGSKDNTEAILKDYQLKRPHMKFISQSNKGLSAARNIGFENTNGEYVWFVDSDDLIHPTALSFIKNYLYRESPRIFHFGVGGYDSVGDNFDKISVFKDDVLEDVSVKKHSTKAYLRNTELIKFYDSSAWSYVVRRDVIGDFRFRDEYFEEEDRLYNIDLLLKEKELDITDAKLYFYLYTPDSILHNPSMEHNRKKNYYLRFIIDGYKELLKHPEIAKDEKMLGMVKGIIEDRLYRYVANLVKLDYSEEEAIKILKELKESGNYPLRRYNKDGDSVCNRSNYHWFIFNIIKRQWGVKLLRNLKRIK